MDGLRGPGATSLRIIISLWPANNRGEATLYCATLLQDFFKSSQQINYTCIGLACFIKITCDAGQEHMQDRSTVRQEIHDVEIHA